MREWLVHGYNGIEPIYERRLPSKDLSESQAVIMLQRLAARHLSDDEVVGSSLKRGSAGCRNHLEINRDKRRGRPLILSTTGTNVHYVAMLKERDSQQ